MFRELFKSLPEGAFWPTGKWFRQLGELLDSDRARLIPGSGSEIASKDGRWLKVKGGTGNGEAQTILVNANGTYATIGVFGTEPVPVTPPEEEE